VQEKFYKTKVAQGLAYPCGKAGDVLENHLLSVGYSKVTIDAVTKTRYCAIELDHPENEDRKTLGENLSCQVFLAQALHILWLGF
jgi:uracil-DNA glycosylase